MQQLRFLFAMANKKAIANKKRNCCILLDLFHQYRAWCTEPQIL